MTKVKKSYLTKHVRRAERQTRAANSNILHVSFWLRKSTGQNTIGRFSVICKFTHNTHVKQYATGIFCKRSEFDPQAITVAGQPVATLLLRDLSAKAQSTYAELRLTNRPIDLEVIWNVANGQIYNLQIPTVASCLEFYMQQEQDRHKAGEIGKTVLEKTRTWNERIRTYTQKMYGQNPQLDDIKPIDAKRFELHIKANFSFCHNYTVDIVKHLKRVLNYAIENEWIDRNPFLNYRCKREIVKGEILTENELNQIRTFDIFSPTLDHIRKAFVFQSFTSLSYKELRTITVQDVLKDEATGSEYIKVCRGKTAKKTGINSLIPLNVEAKAIMQLFDNHPQRLQKGVLIPILSNQKYNEYLKQLQGIMDFKKKLTSHVARRTGATYYLTKGVPLESVSAMLGHSTTAMTQKHYAITRPERVINDFEKNGIKISKAS